MTKKNLLYILLILIGPFLFSILSLGIYALIVLNDAELKINTQEPPAVVKETNCLEKGSIVYKEDLKDSYFFSYNPLPFDTWFERQLKEEIFEKLPNKKEIFINKDVCLGNLIRNSCKHIYCFQHKISFEDLPPKFWKGLIGIEDYRYLGHKGIDYKSIFRAIIADIKALKFVQGGSTLTQQLVKNLFLTNEKSLKRKFKELVFSIYIESKYKKEDILMAYLNEVYWGPIQGIRVKGVYAASLFYFEKRPSELSEYEVAILISLLNGPSYYHPIRRQERLINRTTLVLSKLRSLKLISLNKNQEWSFKKWVRWRKNLIKKNDIKSYKSLWRIEKRQDTEVGPSNSWSDFEKFVFLRSVNRTLNLDRIKKKTQDEDVAIKAYFMDPFCEKDCSSSEFKYYSKYERNLDKAITLERHQVGSILKPIIYSIIHKHGKSMNDLVSTKPITLKLKSGSWTPKEASYIKEDEVTLLKALKKSLNRPLIRLANEIGFESIEQDMKNYIKDLRLPLGEYPAQMLGSVELSLKEITEVYSKFIKNQCSLYSKKFDSSDEENEDTNEVSILHLMLDPTEGTIARVVGERLGQMQFFGKTGTSNNGLDNWYIMFDGREFVVIWLGVESDRVNKKDLKLYGSSSAFQIIKDHYTHRGKRFRSFSCKGNSKQ